MKNRIIITGIDDGGRVGSGNSAEKLDCTVRALAIATGLPYGQIRDALAAAGVRRPGHKAYGFAQYLERCGAIVRPVSRGSVGRYLERRDAGRFIVAVRGHVFAVIDGRPFDNVAIRLRRHVQYVAEIPATFHLEATK